MRLLNIPANHPFPFFLVALPDLEDNNLSSQQIISYNYIALTTVVNGKAVEVFQDDVGLVRCVDWATGGQRGYEIDCYGLQIWESDQNI